ncbi:MAG: hypothetical protein HKO65_00090 [Gemmatimonadetes bacterium]|nr:hypothetical protein [Gemmatimonadota bacterium]
MPIHFSDRDVASEVDGVNSALIVPCIMCPAATVAEREKEPFLQLFKSPFKSAPFERHIKALQSRLADKGVQTEVFKSRVYHQWFMCMWTEGRREKLRQRASGHDAVIVLGCDSATETVREAVNASSCKVIEGMKVSGIINAQLGFRLPGEIVFGSCRIVPISGHKQEASAAH